ncbi:hypothetical protein [Lactococcus lactis]|uniref:hypothetical protein n=1 Tax=Lactococcus lactis TaxID=1358 RepID=UPI001122579C|nr:hypothetical protein [Lactococcus lactis]TNU77556.1 hypothetical protein FIB48_11465 [Lactococcus lactis subsp. lactis]
MVNASVQRILVILLFTYRYRQERGNVPTPPLSATQNNQKQSSPEDSHDPFENSEPMNIQDDQLPFKKRKSPVSHWLTGLFLL